MRRGVALLAVSGLLALSAGALPAHAQAGRPDKNRKGESGTAPAAGLLAEEKGKFRVLLDGKPTGTEEFQISPSGNQWIARGSTEVSLPGGGSAQVTGTLKLNADGAPVRYEWSAQGQKKASATVEFEGGIARMELRMEGSSPFTQEFRFDSPRVVVLDNNLYHHYAVLARLYDPNTKGTQTFPVLIPQDLTPGAITIESLGAQEIEGARLELLRVRSADLEIDLYLDGRRLVRLAVPSAKVEIVRE